MKKVFKESEVAGLRLMAIALIQEGLGRLDPQTEQDLARFTQEGREWRQHLIFKLNGFDLPAPLIVGAIRKKWLDDPNGDVEIFTRTILDEWGLLPV